MKKNKRHFIQLLFIAITNGYLAGFLKGTIFQGQSKTVCVPGLNCYSCPGAVGSCPVGAFQAALTSGGSKNIPYYVLGTVILFGVVLGRLVCGFLCPFGFVQDMLYKIKLPKIKVPKKLDKALRYLKYVVLALFVVILPLFLTNQFGIGTPYFCKWICPSGTLMAGIPLISANESLGAAVGALFYFKLSILVLFLISPIFIYRPFCKYLCPLGAFYALFNKFSFYKLNVDENKCTKCGICTKTCKMGVDAMRDINNSECIRCGDCKNACPHKAISSTIDSTLQYIDKKKNKV